MTRITHTATVPDTLPRKGNWRAHAACRVAPDRMFPGKDAVAIKAAKQICATCPVVTACLRDALDTGDNEYGIRGGLRPDERRRIVDGRARAAKPKPQTRPSRAKQPPTLTLADAFAKHAVPTEDGHLLWHGAKQLRFQKVYHQALKVAFALGRGREPEGRIVRTCGHQKCFLAEHLVDEVLREEGALCGTRYGYRWHRDRGTEECPPCWKAGADDRRAYRAARKDAA